MEVTIDIPFRRKLIDKIIAREFNIREGVHCSDLLHCLNKSALRRLNPIKESDERVLLYSLGYASQRWLVGKLKDEDTILLDGIQVTPDAVEDGCVWELKATYASSNRPITDNIAYIRQLMCQCKVTNTTTARLSRFEIMGDWKFKEGAKRPTLSVFYFTFTPEEIDANWKWLLERKDLFESILKTKKRLPKLVVLPAGQGFECKGCEYAETCTPEILDTTADADDGSDK